MAKFGGARSAGCCAIDKNMAFLRFTGLLFTPSWSCSAPRRYWGVLACPGIIYVSVLKVGKTECSLIFPCEKSVICL